jgi:GNAT superfamily N-acetyltransferase
MTELIDFDGDRHHDELRRLLTAYLEEAVPALMEVGIKEDIPGIVSDDLAHPEKFSPPNGRRLLGVDDGAVLGCGAMRVIGPGVAEIKRMYLQPEARGRGLGRMMIDGLLDSARDMGCHEARLDSGWFMTDAHRLYRAAGFTACDPYPESEIPPDFDARWVYMRRDL